MNREIYIVMYSFILVSSLIYIWHKLLNRKINFRDYKLYISLLGIMCIAVINYFMVDKYIKITIITIVFMFFFRFLFNEKLQKCIITPIYYQLIIMICETLYALILSNILKKDSNAIINSYFGEFFSNIIISLISIILINFKCISKFYNIILDFTDKISKYQLILFSCILIVIANMFAVISYYKIRFQYIIILNTIITIGCYMIILYSFRAQNKYNKVSDKYNIAINSLRDYEDIMNKYRIANHENKNLLLAVRAMIINGEKDVPKYIDSIVNNKYNDNEKLLFKMNNIPSGGLRATIYSEILKIKDNKINYGLHIDKNLKMVDLIELDTNAIIDICKIIGVFIDNAIEEVNELKNKKIDISLYIDNDCLIIKVSNSYRNKIEIDKIYNNGYTTKGPGHGYGLSLVKNIIDDNNIFKNSLEISKDLFSQTLIVNYKKSR